MDIKPLRKNEQKIGCWLKLYGTYIQNREIRLTDEQLKKAAELVNSIFNKIQDNSQQEEER